MNTINEKTIYILAERVLNRRQELGLTQEELAYKCDLDRTYISLIERGKINPSFTHLLKLCIGLNTSLSNLAKDIY